MNYNTGIYQIVNQINGKKYIGSGFDLRKREREHNRLLNINNHSNSYLQNSYNKYGKENFKFEILLYCDKENLLFYEQRAIDIYDFKKELYNLSPTAGNCLGIKHSLEANIKKSILQKGHTVSLETRKKISEAQVGKKLSIEHKKKLSESHKNPSEETRKKISEASKGRKCSLETRKKISEANKGRIVSADTRKKLSKLNSGKNNYNYGKYGKLNHFFGKKHTKKSREKISKALKGKNHPFYGKHFSEEHKRKISESNKNKKVSIETKKKMSESKKIKFNEKQLNEIKNMRSEGFSYREIAKHFNCSTTPIYSIIKK